MTAIHSVALCLTSLSLKGGKKQERAMESPHVNLHIVFC